MDTKPGYKTTEFWITVIGNATDLVTAVSGALPPDKALWIAAAINSFYAISRGLAKKPVSQ